MNRTTLRVHVIGTELPGRRFAVEGTAHEPVYVGIQRGREVIDAVPADRTRVTFDAEFDVSEQPDGRPNFLGPYAQGDRHDRFFYLSWGVKHGDRLQMFRRLKIRLGHLRWAEINAAAQSGRPLVVHLKLTDKKGGPLCATPPVTHIRWASS
jgi:hypothetical protein